MARCPKCKSKISTSELLVLKNSFELQCKNCKSYLKADIAVKYTINIIGILLLFMLIKYVNRFIHMSNNVQGIVLVVLFLILYYLSLGLTRLKVIEDKGAKR